MGDGKHVTRCKGGYHASDTFGECSYCCREIGEACRENDLAARIAESGAGAPASPPAIAPGHTDLMIAPEDIDAALAAYEAQASEPASPPEGGEGGKESASLKGPSYPASPEPASGLGPTGGYLSRAVIGVASNDAPSLTFSQIDAVAAGDEIWVDSMVSGPGNTPGGWHRAVTVGDEPELRGTRCWQPIMVEGGHWPEAQRIRAHRPASAMSAREGRDPQGLGAKPASAADREASGTPLSPSSIRAEALREAAGKAREFDKNRLTYDGNGVLHSSKAGAKIADAILSLIPTAEGGETPAPKEASDDR